jgi:hypothetical protein
MLRSIFVATVAISLLASPAASESKGIMQAQKEGLLLVLTRDGDREGLRIAVVAEDWFYCDPDTRRLYLVPAGYKTDFASIPPIARPFLGQFGRWAEAAVVHDYLYALGERGFRNEADRIFATAMKEQDVGPITRRIMYLAVKWFGHKAYDREHKNWKEYFVDPRTGLHDNPLPPHRLPDRISPPHVTVVCDCDAIEEPSRRAALRATYGGPRYFKAEPTPTCSDRSCP